MLYEKLSGFSDEISSDITTQFEVITKLGIKYFEPRGINGKNISELSEEEAYELKKKMDSCGIKASSIGSPIGKIKLTDDFSKHFELFKKVVGTAKILDCKYIRMFSFYHDGDEWTSDERELVIKQLGQLIEYAKQNDVILLHENEKDVYGDTAERCADLMGELFCDNFKAVFDPANFVQTGEDAWKAFTVMKNYVVYMHIKDADATNRVVPAGYGLGNVEKILATLFENGYDGFISLEPHLGSFEGLADLELTDIADELPEGGEGTFKMAYDALCDILNKIL